MKENFDKTINRKGTGSVKWDCVKEIFGSDEILPMWIADMDFPVAPQITKAIEKRLEHPIFGYTKPWKSLIDSVTERIKKKYDWEIESEWVVFTPGVVPAISTAIKAFTSPGDEVILQGPVYYPFRDTIKENGCHITNNKLKLENGKYVMDYKDLEDKFKPKKLFFPKPSGVKAAILCNPHNPVGRMWSKKEQEKFGEIVIKHNAVVISDEIHSELILSNKKHLPFASISKEFEQNSITCFSPSKTFNLAGLSVSSIIIPNEKLRTEFIRAGGHILGNVSILSLIALEAAYRYGDEWLSELLEYLKENLTFLLKYFEENIPEIKVIKPEATYLVWLDFRKLRMKGKELSEFLIKKAKVGLDDGYFFGPSGDGFARINIACPRSVLKEGLKRIENAVKDIRSNGARI